MNKSYSYRHLADHALKPTLSEFLKSERGSLADGLAVMAEIDTRRLYLPAAYPSMIRYLVGEHEFSVDEAYLRIRVVRCARKFPAIFPMIDDGRLGMTSVLLLAPTLTRENSAELLTAAAKKTKFEIAELLAERFPRPDLPTLVQAVSPTVAGERLGPVPVLLVDAPAPELVQVLTERRDPVLASASERPVAPESVAPGTQLAPELVAPPAPRPKVTPLAPERYAWQVTVSRETNDKLRRARELLSHAVPSGDMALVLERALDALIEKCERRKHAATERPGRRRISAHGNCIPAAVQREVWQRDGGSRL